VSNISLQNNKVRKQLTELTVPLIVVLKCSLHDIFGALKKREKFMKTENISFCSRVLYSFAKLVKVHQNRQIKVASLQKQMVLY